MTLENLIGKCGITCNICKNFDNGCLGCIKENVLNPVCVIFKCSMEKKIDYCLQCIEFPCRLMRGLSKSYCPVFSRF